MDDNATSPDNRAAVRKDMLDAMTRAGIGRHYHDAGLTQFGEFGIAFRDRIVSRLFFEFEDGLNFIVHGKKSRDFSIIAARALLLASWTVRVTTPTKLAALFEDKRYSEIESLESVKTLVVLGMSEPGDSPFSPWLRRRVEGVITDRLEERRPVIAQVELVRGSRPLGWWSGPFAEQLTERSEMLEVKS